MPLATESVSELISISGFQDPMSSLSHLAGLAIFLLLAPFVLSTALRSKSVFIFVLQFVLATLVLLSMSFVYHMLEYGWIARNVMLRLDVAAIFVLIASSFTVLHGILFDDWRRWAIITSIWCITIVGITLRSIFFDTIPGIVGDGIFLAIGWLGAYSMYLVAKKYSWRAVSPIAGGGICYSIGAVSNAADWPVLIPGVWGPHETFHLFVLAGIGIHWSFVWSLADGTFFKKFAPKSPVQREVGTLRTSGDVN